MLHYHLDYFQKPPLGGRSNMRLGDHGTPNAHNCWFILFYHVWGPARIDIHWNSIWLRAQSHMTSHYTWGSLITLHDFGGVLGWPLDTFFWALKISWSRLLARVWSGPDTQLGGTHARFHNAISCHMLPHIISKVYTLKSQGLAHEFILDIHIQRMSYMTWLKHIVKV